jgi:hypothetical protein
MSIARRGPFRQAGMRWRSLHMVALFALILSGSAACVTPGGSNGPPPTASPPPRPGFLGAVEEICTETQGTRIQLAARTRTVVDSQVLVDQGTVLALKSGILSSALRRIRAVTQLPMDSDAVAHWLVTLDEGLAAYVRAVAASANRDLDSFVRARADGDKLLATAATEADQVGAVWCRF